MAGPFHTLLLLLTAASLGGLTEGQGQCGPFDTPCPGATNNAVVPGCCGDLWWECCRLADGSSYCNEPRFGGPCGGCGPGSSKCITIEGAICLENESVCSNGQCCFGGEKCCDGVCCSQSPEAAPCCAGACCKDAAGNNKPCCKGQCCASTSSLCSDQGCSSKCGIRESDCPDGYTLNSKNGLCMAYNAASVNLSTANSACASSGGMLAPIATQTDLDAVAELCQQSRFCWVNVIQAPNSASPKANWTTTTLTGKKLPVNPAFWSTGEPNDNYTPVEDNQENCGIAFGPSLYDYPCKTLVGYVCAATVAKRNVTGYCPEPKVCCHGKCVDSVTGDPTLPCDGLCCNFAVPAASSPKNVSLPILKKNGWCCNNVCCTGTEKCCRGPDGLGCGTKCGTKCCRKGAKCCGGRCVSDQVYCDGLCCTGSKGQPAACCTNPKTGKKACC